jgi:hypothetical protein
VSDRLSDVPRPAGGYTIRSDDVRETTGGMENVFVPLQMLPGSAATNDEDGRIAFAAPDRSTTSSSSMVCNCTTPIDTASSLRAS